MRSDGVARLQEKDISKVFLILQCPWCYNGAASCTRFFFPFFCDSKMSCELFYAAVCSMVYHHPRVSTIDFNLKSKTRWECRMKFVWLMCTRSHDTTRNRFSVRMWLRFSSRGFVRIFLPFFFRSLACFCKKQTKTKAMYQKLQMANAFASHMNHRSSHTRHWHALSGFASVHSCIVSAERAQAHGPTFAPKCTRREHLEYRSSFLLILLMLFRMALDVTTSCFATNVYVHFFFRCIFRLANPRNGTQGKGDKSKTEFP